MTTFAIRFDNGPHELPDELLASRAELGRVARAMLTGLDRGQIIEGIHVLQLAPLLQPPVHGRSSAGEQAECRHAEQRGLARHGASRSDNEVSSVHERARVQRAVRKPDVRQAQGSDGATLLGPAGKNHAKNRWFAAHPAQHICKERVVGAVIESA